MGLRNGGQEIGGRTGLDNRRRASAFDPLNPPGGPPVAAWLAEDFGEIVPGYWRSTNGTYQVPSEDSWGDGIPTVVTVGGKSRVRCPASSNVSSLFAQSADATIPFSVPSGACSIVLVSATLGANPEDDPTGGVIISNGSTDYLVAPSSVDYNAVKVNAVGIAATSAVNNSNAHVRILQNTDASSAAIWQTYIDGANDVNDAADTPWGNLWIGVSGGPYPNDDIVAILIFDRVLSLSEIADYTTWGIAEAGS